MTDLLKQYGSLENNDKMCRVIQKGVISKIVSGGFTCLNFKDLSFVHQKVLEKSSEIYKK